MTVESVKAFFAENAPDIAVIEAGASTATVQLAAETFGVEPGQIAKTLSYRVGDDVVLIVAKGDARIDNKKFKAHFGTKARMLPLDEVEAETGHPVGGVCPFGLAKPLRVCCDVSLKEYAEVLPAAGGPSAAVRIAPDRLLQLTGGEWVDVAQSQTPTE